MLRYVATLVRHPRPKVPIPAGIDPVEQESANNRERYLLALWRDLMKQWRKIELNASKVGYGVLEIIWDPPAATTVRVGPGEGVRDEQRYVTNPFHTRSIRPERFYPTYRTFDEPDNFLYTFEHDPRRLLTPIEQKYGVELQGTGLDDGYMSSARSDTAPGIEPTCELIKYWDEELYILIAVTRILQFKEHPRGAGSRGAREVEPVELKRLALLEYNEHDMGRVPIWVIQNIENPDYDPTNEGTIADTDDIVSLNRHYNWIVSEEADEVAMHIHRPAVYQSEEHQQDVNLIKMEPGAIIPIGPPGEEELKGIENWKPEPGFVDSHLNRILSGIKELSFLSEAGFGNLPAGVSGVAAKVALTPFEQIIELKLPPRQVALESICGFLLEQFEKHAGETKFAGWVSGELSRFGQSVVISEADVRGQYEVEVDYGNLMPRDDNAHEQNEMFKFSTGAQALVDTLDNLGEPDPRAAVERLKAENLDPELNPEKVLQIIEARRMLKQEQMENAALEQAGGDNAPENQAMAAAASEEGEGGADVPTNGGGAGEQIPGATKQEAPPTPSGEAFPTDESGGGFGAGAATPGMDRTMAPNFPIKGPGQQEEQRRRGGNR